MNLSALGADNEPERPGSGTMNLRASEGIATLGGLGERSRTNAPMGSAVLAAGAVRV